MAKTNKKLSVKKETLRKLDSLTADQLGQVAGGTEKVGYSVIVPPSRGPVTGGCQPSDGCINLTIQNVNVIKGY